MKALKEFWPLIINLVALAYAAGILYNKVDHLEKQLDHLPERMAVIEQIVLGKVANKQ